MTVLAALRYLFDVRGRVTRARFWLTYLGYGAYFLIVVLIAQALRPDNDTIFFVAWLPGAAAVLSAMVRRAHDRGRGASWLIAWFFVVPIASITVPFLLLIPLQINGRMSEQLSAIVFGTVATLASLPMWWVMIEIGFLRGTRGENRFGPDPLELTDDHVGQLVAEAH
jgi:uncharacterized membrane protein YhaH (DUF805 family)